MSTPLPAHDALLRYLDAYARRDLAAIAAMLAPDVHLQDWNLSAAGADAVLADTRKNFDAVSRLRIEVRRVFAAGSHAAAELTIRVDEHIVLDAVDVLEFDDRGRIRAIRAYKG